MSCLYFLDQYLGWLLLSLMALGIGWTVCWMERQDRNRKDPIRFLLANVTPERKYLDSVSDADYLEAEKMGAKTHVGQRLRKVE